MIEMINFFIVGSLEEIELFLKDTQKDFSTNYLLGNHVEIIFNW